jgi:transcriptional regulator with XRE-family HTH domain
VSDGSEAQHGARLRLARRARGLSQQQLADVAGVSRQAISLWESGEHDPSLRVAFALASALDMTVEELFGRDERAVPVTARPVTPLGAQRARVTLAPLGNGYVALPLRGGTTSRSGFLPAGGLTAETASDREQSRKVEPIGPPRPTLVAAGCDPATAPG